MKYCMECGTILEVKEVKNEGMVPFCPSCNQYRFPVYSTAVSMIVRDIQTKEILLIQQYGKKDYILVAGYVNLGEGLEAAVVREVLEETGMKVQGLSFNHSEYYERTNTLMCNFTVYVHKEEMNPNEEIDSYCWFTKEEAVENIRPNSLARKFLMRYLDNDSE